MKILVTGAFGLVGTDLVIELKKKFGIGNVIALSHNILTSDYQGTVEKGDVSVIGDLERVVKKHNITDVYHLAGLLSVASEKNPELAWRVNLGGLKNVLDIGVKRKLKIFWPSSIAAFGPTTPKIKTPQHTVLEPTTMYGLNKVTGELLCQYYFLRYGLDVRSLSFSGFIGYTAPPGDGTTEYSVHIFYGAIMKNRYTCFLKKDTVLPMMYIDDAIGGTMKLMGSDPKKITVRTSYNFGAVSFSPQDLVAEIKKLLPGFTCDYKPDHRQQIADSWPKTIDDSQARKDWGWQPKYDLSKMTQVMLHGVKSKSI